ncbi:BCCT family transporter [Allobacillus sp. GCM10007491]|uniref:BCCT family transporter n=1 Tax=Allobacillus TaxID=1400133 RepID=UPI002350BDFE|nr:BCCT family transporter [Allobacillus saliphilus]
MVYVAVTAFYIGFCIYLGVGPYRKMKLGKKNDQPEYSYFAWIGLLFAAGMGVGLVFWGFAEPISHYITAPGAATEPETEKAVRHGLLLGVFHWGFQPWAIYAVVALGLAFAKFRKNLPGLISSTFYPLIGNRVHGWQGKTIDIIAIVATTVGIATSFGLSTMQFGEGSSEVFSLPDNNWRLVGIVVVITVIFLTSALTGLNKGMKYLSVGNLWLSVVVLIAVLLVGPTFFLLEHLLKTIGDYGANIFQYTFNTTPYSSDNQWMGDWTLFYWAWIISWSPFLSSTRLLHAFRKAAPSVNLCSVYLSYQQR